MEPNMTTQTEPKGKWILKWALIIGIVIVTNLFAAYAIDVVYDEPDYTAFCEEKQVQEVYRTQDACVQAGGQWTPSIEKYDPSTGRAIPVMEGEETTTGYCDPDFTCRQGYQDALSLYQRNVFIILSVLGVLLIIGSLFIAQIEAVSLGLSFAGVLSLIIGTIRYWSNMDEYLRVIVLGIALAALIWIGIKKFKN